MPQKPKKNPPPATSFRLGRIQAAVWERESPKGSFYVVTFHRSYQEDGKWQSTDSYGRDDLLLVAKLADMAHTWIAQNSKPVAEPEQAA